jgi:hypothetical protein
MQAAAAWCNDGPSQHVQLRRWFSGSLDVGLALDLEAEQRGVAIAARMFARFKDRTTTDVNKALNDIMAGRDAGFSEYQEVARKGHRRIWRAVGLDERHC